MSDTKMTLPSGGGAYERLADGTLKQVEATKLYEDPADGLAAGLEAPVEGAVERPAKPKLKES